MLNADIITLEYRTLTFFQWESMNSSGGYVGFFSYDQNQVSLDCTGPSLVNIMPAKDIYIITHCFYNRR